MPAGVPCFLLSGHAVEPDALHDSLDFMQGHGREVQLFTVAPRYAEVSLDLSEAQAGQVDEWMQTALVVLTAPWTAEIAPLGASSRYWAAQWVAPPAWSPRARKQADGSHSTRWRLSGRLLLTGEGSDAKPLGGVLSTTYTIDLTGSVRISAAVALDTEYTVDLRSINALQTEYTIDLEQDVPTYYDREDTGFIERESGGFLQRE